MTKIVKVPNGVLTLAESKAECPHCKTHIPFDEIETKWRKCRKHYMRMKCRCAKFIGITSDIKGDFIAYKL